MQNGGGATLVPTTTTPVATATTTTTTTTPVDFPTMLRDLEIACYNFSKNPSKRTQEGIDEFRNSKHVLSASIYVLQHSTKPDVHNQAISALKESILKKWDTISLDEITQVRNHLLDYATGVLPVKTEISITEKKQAINAVASIVKRGWLSIDFQETVQTLQMNEQIFQQLGVLLNGSTLELREAGIGLCIELVSEFSTVSASKFNLPWEFHITAKKSFENTHLQQIFIFMLQTSQMMLSFSEEQRQLAKKLFMSCLSLLDKILGWPYLDDTIESSTKIQPGPSWRHLLVERTDVLQLYFKMYMECKTDKELSQLISQGFVQLASLGGDIFENANQQQNYLQNFIQGIFHVVSCSTFPSPEDTLSLSLAFSRCATNFPVDMFRNLLSDANYFFDNFTKFTYNVLLKAREPTQSEAYLDAFNDLLSAWVTFVDPSVIEPSKIQFYQDYCGTVFQIYMETILYLASRSDDVSSQEDLFSVSELDQLSEVAQLGRIAIGTSASLLVKHLTEKLQILANSLQNSPMVIPDSLLTEINFLVLLSGCLLADEDTQPNNNNNNDNNTLETTNSQAKTPPLIPITVNMLSAQCSAQKQTDIIVALIKTIFKMIEFENFCIRNGKTEIWSSSVADTFMWFLNRWGCTYLFHPNTSDLAPNLIESFGNSSPQTISLIEFYIQKIMLNLLMWPSEVSVVEGGCDVMFVLSRRQVPPTLLSSLKCWDELIGIHTSSDRRLNQLPPVTQRKFIEALFTILSSGDASMGQQVTDILRGIKDTLATLIAQASRTPLPELNKAVVVQLEKARGIARATKEKPSNAGFLFTFFSEFFTPLIHLFRFMKDNHEIVKTILGLWLDISRNILPYLPDEIKERFLGTCMDLFTVFQECGLGKRKRKQTTQQDEQQQTNITKVLKICYTVSKIGHPRSSRIAYFGTNTVLTALCAELLQFPKLAQLYYNLLYSLFKDHTDKLPLIPIQMFNDFILTINNALTLPDISETCRKCALDSIGLMIGYHFTVKIRENKDIFNESHKTVIVSIFPKVLAFLTSDDVGNKSIVESTSNAFFALICFDQAKYQQSIQQFVNTLSINEPLKSQTLQAFLSLGNIPGMDYTFSAINCSRFAVPFTSLLNVCRGRVKTR